jgi:hypothetical protein
VSAVAAARAAARDPLFPAEGQTTAAPVSCYDVNVDFVNKHQNLVI